MTSEPVADLLQRIVAQRRARLGSEVGLFDDLESGPPLGGEQPFLAALAQARGSAVVAEVKLGSPRLGSLVGRVEPERQARIYRDHGATALSVVVEPDFFHGDYELLTACKAASGLPALAKDFVVTRRQLDLALDAGADAVLLVAALYTAEELRGWAGAARSRGLVPLIETHSEPDLAKLERSDAAATWELVGVNNRDLRTFDVELERSIALRPALPTGALAIAESGISGGEDRRRLAAAGFDAFLVGEALLLADDPGAKLGELLSG